jgi:hypothetical protein
MDTFRGDSDSIESNIEMYLCIHAMSNSDDIYNILNSMDTFRDDSDSIESLIEMYLCIYAMSNSEDIHNILNNNISQK